MFRFESDKCYRMPAHFSGWPYHPVENAYHDVTSMIFTFKTDGERLSAYIPEGFELLRPEFTINYAQCREIDWMAGSAYNLIDVSAPVRFKGRRDTVEGTYSLVVWENKTEPILGGREETGVSKIYSDIQDLHSFQDKRFAVASYEGNSFLWLEMTITGPADDATAERMRYMPVDSMHWRYIPKVGGPGADLSQAVLYPQRSEMEKVWLGDGAVKWTILRQEQSPMQAHIIKALAELPVLETYPAILGKGAIYLTSSMARVLE